MTFQPIMQLAQQRIGAIVREALVVSAIFNVMLASGFSLPRIVLSTISFGFLSLYGKLFYAFYHRSLPSGAAAFQDLPAVARALSLSLPLTLTLVTFAAALLVNKPAPTPVDVLYGIVAVLVLLAIFTVSFFSTLPRSRTPD